jgi:hypothetical protein
MQDLYVAATGEAGVDVGHGGVDAAGAAAAAGNEEGEFAGVEAEGGEAFFTGGGEDFGADGVAGDDDLVRIGAKIFGGFGVADGDFGGETGEDAVGDAGDDVLFLDEDGDAEETGGEEDGAADVAAGADDDVGAEAADDAVGFERPAKARARARRLARVRRRSMPPASTVAKGKPSLGTMSASRPWRVPTKRMSAGWMPLMARAMVRAGRCGRRCRRRIL